MVGAGAGSHALSFAEICRSPRFHKAMVEGVVRIEMQMDEGWGRVLRWHDVIYLCLLNAVQVFHHGSELHPVLLLQLNSKTHAKCWRKPEGTYHCNGPLANSVMGHTQKLMAGGSYLSG
jgi:hypothetical protein